MMHIYNVYQLKGCLTLSVAPGKKKTVELSNDFFFVWGVCISSALICSSC
jgi:hypothetical protein